MTPADFITAQKTLGLSNAQAAQVLRFNSLTSISNMRRGATPITPQTAELLRAYLSGYRCADWPT